MTISTSRQFIGLPSEILTEVLINLDPLSVVCSVLKRIVRQSSELLYVIELHREGMVDTGNTKLSPQERLEQLRSRRKAWAHMDWKTASVVQLNGICHAYELVGGVFAHGDNGGAEFVMSSLPSSTACGHQIRCRDLEAQPRDFAIDPGQDLVVFIDAHGNPVSFEAARVLRLHFRSISTREVHPKARSPVVPVVVPPNVTHGTFVRGVTLQIADDVVAVMLYTGRQQLVICNWKDGFLITDSTEQGHDVHGEAEFAFISPRAYLLTFPEGDGSIRIYSFESVEGYSPFHIATLHLPTLRPESRLQSLSVHTGPFETPSPDDPFVTSPTSRIYVFTVSILYDRIQLDIEPQPDIFYLFVKCSTFLSFLRSKQPGMLEAVSMPWSRWGPIETRLLPGFSPYSSWMRYVHGQRVVLPRRTGSSDMPVIRVLDFNVHRTSPSGESETDAPIIWTTPTRIQHCFQETVVTTLPYSVGSCVLSELSNEYSAFMIDEERIVGIKAKGAFDQEIQELHVFTF